jgi:hypothetical protein
MAVIESSWNVIEAQKLREKWHEMERARYGEERYEAIKKAMAQAFDGLRPAVGGALQEALMRGFDRKASRLEGESMLLEFSNPTGEFYSRKIGFRRKLKHFNIPDWWYTELGNNLVCYVLRYGGFSTARVCRKHRVRAEIEPSKP